VTGSNNPKRYSPEFKDEAARMVVDLSRPIAQVAEELGINRTTLGFWVKTYRQYHSGDELSMDMPDQAWNRPDETADITDQPYSTDQPAYIAGQPSYIAGQPADRGDNAERAELTRRVSAALAGLDHDEREVIELHLRHDLDIADLATVLGMPRDKVDALASRARGKLERALGALLVARMGRESCPALDSLLAGWDGRLTTLTAPTRYLVTQHIERCEACEKGSRRALRAAVLSGIGPPAALPSGLREQVLNLGASRNPDAAAGRPDVVQRAASRSPNELAGATRFPWWSRIRANPGAATATGAIALWGMAALSAVLILVTGGRAVGDLAVHIGNGPVATASAPASPSSGVSARAKASSPPAPGSPPSAGAPAPAAALAGAPTAPGSPAVPGSQASPSDSPQPSAFPSLSASSSPSQLPAPLRSSTATPAPSPSLSPSSSPSPSPSPSLSLSPSPSPSPSSTRTRRPRPSHSRSPSPRPSSSTATPSPTASLPPFPLSL
jgi:RNA polymerase sigma factor (sigma-70 family)